MEYRRLRRRLPNGSRGVKRRHGVGALTCANLRTSITTPPQDSLAGLPEHDAIPIPGRGNAITCAGLDLLVPA